MDKVRPVAFGVARVTTYEDHVRVYHSLHNTRVFQEAEPKAIEFDFVDAEMLDALLARTIPHSHPLPSIPAAHSLLARTISHW